jgi:hypothetical protein
MSVEIVILIGLSSVKNSLLLNLFDGVWEKDRCSISNRKHILHKLYIKEKCIGVGSVSSGFSNYRSAGNQYGRK